MGMIFYVILSCCFCWIWLWNWLVFELSVCDGLKLLCFCYLWTHVVITMWTPMYEVLVNYLWNGCNMWLVMLNHYNLGCMQVGLKSFVVSVDYRVYMGSSSRIWSFRRLFLYLCSYKLVGSVTRLARPLGRNSVSPNPEAGGSVSPDGDSYHRATIPGPNA